MIATIIAMAATTVMIGAMDGGAIEPESNRLFIRQDTAAAKSNQLWAAALFLELQFDRRAISPLIFCL